MIDSLFFISTECESFYERHWNKVLKISVCSNLIEYINRKTSTIPSVIKSQNYVIVNTSEDDTYFAAVVSKEASPFYIVELLNLIKETLKSILKNCYSANLKEKISYVYMIIDEIFMSGMPVLGMSSLVSQVFKPTNVVDKMAMTFGITDVKPIVSKHLLEPAIWKDKSVNFSTNEILLDIIEELNTLIDHKGKIVTGSIKGKITSNAKLNGLPRVVLHFESNNRLLFNDISLNQIVSKVNFEANHVIDFIPPLGTTVLMKYNSFLNDYSLPFNIHCSANYSKKTFDIIVSLKNGPSNLEVANILVIVVVPDEVTDFEPTFYDDNFIFSPYYRTIKWRVGSMNAECTRKRLSGRLITGFPGPLPSNLMAKVQFEIPQNSFSNIKISKLQVLNENYPMFKGARYSSKSGNCDIRFHEEN